MADEAQLPGGRLLQRRVLPAELWLAGVHGHANADVRWRIRLHLRGLRISRVGEYKQPRVSRGDVWVHPDAVVQPELREAAAHQSVFVCGAQSVVGAEWRSEKRTCGAGLCRAALLYSVEPRICPLRPTLRGAKRALQVQSQFQDVRAVVRIFNRRCAPGASRLPRFSLPSLRRSRAVCRVIVPALRRPFEPAALTRTLAVFSC